MVSFQNGRFSLSRMADSLFQSIFFFPPVRIILVWRSTEFSLQDSERYFFFFVFVVASFMEPVIAAMEGSTAQDRPSMIAHKEKEEHTCLFIMRNWALKQGNHFEKQQAVLDHPFRRTLAGSMPDQVEALVCSEYRTAIRSWLGLTLP